MALPAHLLERLPPELLRALEQPRGHPSPAFSSCARVLQLGCPDFDALLPDGGVLRGQVMELAVTGGSSLATSIVLAACRAAQRAEAWQSGTGPWCAYLDPTGTLYAPGVSAAGVDLRRLLVIRPAREALGRVALRVVKSRAFSVVAVDLVALPGAVFRSGVEGALASREEEAHRGPSLGSWVRIVRRLSLAAKETETCVLLITDRAAARPVPLPVAMRIELGRPAAGRLSLRIAKEQRGRISPPRSIHWTRPAEQEAVLRVGEKLWGQ